MVKLTTRQIWKLLDEVKDPEIPVVSVVEMGIIQDVKVEKGKVQVDMAPTFSACPALHMMREEVEATLKKAGVEDVEVKLHPGSSWSSDRITPEGRQKLRTFGLVPPPVHRGNLGLALLEPVACPRCGSENTSLKNPFGSTLCRSIFVCNACGEPFEQFKPL